MKEPDRARQRHRARGVVVVPSVLLILLGVAMVVMGAGIIAKNLWAGLLLILVGIAGPGFRGAVRLWRPRS